MQDIGSEVCQVDECIHVLLRARMSTSVLRYAAQAGADVTNMADFRMSLVLLAFLFWYSNMPVLTQWTADPLTVASVVAMLFLFCLMAVSSMDRKAFAAYV